MGPNTLWDYFKEFVCFISWRLFLWSIDKTQEQYREEIYLQEKRFREG